MDVSKSQMAPFYIFWHYETVRNSHFSFLPENFSMVSKGPPSILKIFSINLDFQKAQSVTFYNFRHCEIFQND